MPMKGSRTGGASVAGVVLAGAGGLPPPAARSERRCPRGDFPVKGGGNGLGLSSRAALARSGRLQRPRPRNVVRARGGGRPVDAPLFCFLFFWTSTGEPGAVVRVHENYLLLSLKHSFHVSPSGTPSSSPSTPANDCPMACMSLTDSSDPTDPSFSCPSPRYCSSSEPTATAAASTSISGSER